MGPATSLTKHGWPNHRNARFKLISPLFVAVFVSALGLITQFQARIHTSQGDVNHQHEINSPVTSGASDPASHALVHDDSNKADEVILEEYPQHQECVIYDRSMRTGSTTISTILKSCLIQKGYRFPKLYPKDGKAGLRMLPRMLRVNASRVGLSSIHIRILQADVDDLLTKCDNVLFIPSCAPMQERMWSGVKYELGHPSTSRNRNSTVSLRKEAALRMILAQERFEDTREAYPFVNVNNEPLPIYQKLIPDYVIRKERMGEAFRSLLEALGCSSEIKTQNVHSEEDDSIKRGIDDVPLKHNHKTYHWLSELANRNSIGLERARAFGSVLRGPAV